MSRERWWYWNADELLSPVLMAVPPAGVGAARGNLLIFATVFALVFLPACGGDEATPMEEVHRADLVRRDFDGVLENGCLTSGCHQQLAQSRWVHGPTAVQACASCHKAQTEEHGEHRFEAAVPTREMCLRCHKNAAADEFVHEPFGSANCTACHDPHGGERKNFLLTERVEDLCLSCHPSESVAVPHQPRDQGDCLSCHNSHSSRHEHLLLRQEEELCSACHREFRGFLAENIVDAGLVTRVHPAILTGGCLACHQAHGSQRHAMMRDELHTNCQRCHSDLDSGLEDAAVVHEAFGRDDSCILCHTPHASVYDGLLAHSPQEVCFQCHAESVETTTGRVIPSVKEQVESAAVVHKPVAEGDCTVCHVAHFSPRRSLLKLKYPHKIYGKFSGGSYELCFQCHDRQLVQEGSRFTDFRDGDVNLHFVHVNRPKGRACDICHDPHASEGFRLVRDFYPFGPSRWKLPLGFEPSAAGGSCTTACHETKTYVR